MANRKPGKPGKPHASAKEAPRIASKGPKRAPAKTPTRASSKETTRAASKEATRAALIAAGLEELSEKGLTTPSLDAICARAGFTRGAFYVHFQDRDAFLVAVMDEVLGGFLTTLMTRSGEPGDITSAIELFAEAAAARSPAVHGGTAMRFHHLMEACRTSPAIGERYRALIRGLRDYFASQIEASQSQGSLRNEISGKRLADLLLACGLGIVAMLELELEVDPVALGKTMTTLLGADKKAKR